VTSTSLHPELRAQLAQNRETIRARIQRAAHAAGRDPASIQLIAVTKSVDVSVAQALFELGETQLAENRLPSFDAKLAAFPAAPTWHFIGHVQRNKARRVVERAAVIHSLDSLRLVEHVARIAAELELRRTVYLQVKIADEESKHGLAPAELVPAIEAVLEAPSLQLAGLMSMAPLCGGATPEERRAAAADTFHQTRQLAARWPELHLGLSMGMTGDFEEAIHAGSTAVRIGSAFFEGLDPTPRHG
jgi:pyridoxal phosphate enzyme (YggS family)